jgi:hypothetical protein
MPSNLLSDAESPPDDELVETTQNTRWNDESSRRAHIPVEFSLDRVKQLGGILHLTERAW